MLATLSCVGFVLQGRLSTTPQPGLRASHTSVLMSSIEEEIVRVAIAAGREAADVVVARVGVSSWWFRPVVASSRYNDGVYSTR